MICDQCSKKRKRCNRERPTCYRCAWAGDVCTWERADAQSKTQSFDRVSMTLVRKRTSRTKQLEKKVVKTKRNTKYSSDSDSVSVSPYQPKDKEFVATSAWNNIVNKWMTKPSLKIVLNIILKSCGINLLFLSKQDEKYISNFLLTKFTPGYISPSMPLHLLYKNNEVMGIIKLSTEAYFYYFNSFWPLMTYYQFISKPRSKLLKLAICTTGLCLLPHSALGDTLIKLNTIELKAKLVPSKLKFDLDTAQTMLVYAIFHVQRLDSSGTNIQLNIAAIILSGLSNKSTYRNFEYVLARRFLANIETTFLHHLYSYTNEELSCYQSSLKATLITKQRLCLQLNKWETTLIIPPTYPLEVHQYVKLEHFVSLIISEAITLIFKKSKDLSNQLFQQGKYELLDILVPVNAAINDINSYYYHMIITLRKFLNTITMFLRQYHNYKDHQTILNDLADSLNLNSIFHIFKINLCFAILQVMDVIPRHHYDHKPSLPLLQPITLQSLFFASQLIHLIRQVDMNSPVILHRPRLIFFAFRINAFHSQFINPPKNTSLNLARSMLQSYLQIPHLAPTVKGIQQAIDLISSI